MTRSALAIPIVVLAATLAAPAGAHTIPIHVHLTAPGPGDRPATDAPAPLYADHHRGRAFLGLDASLSLDAHRWAPVAPGPAAGASHATSARRATVAALASATLAPEVRVVHAQPASDRAPERAAHPRTRPRVLDRIDINLANRRLSPAAAWASTLEATTIPSPAAAVLGALAALGVRRRLKTARHDDHDD
jgi:hypothetical protein